MLDVFVGKALAVGTLGEAHAFAEGAVVGFGVGCVEHGNGVAAGNAYWHRVWCVSTWRAWKGGRGVCRESAGCWSNVWKSEFRLAWFLIPTTLLSHFLRLLYVFLIDFSLHRLLRLPHHRHHQYLTYVHLFTHKTYIAYYAVVCPHLDMER
jgi:hypothetical protein